MTDVERLYELFQDIKCPNIFMCNAHELQLAEYLAANDVTVQQWTPASQPPEVWRDKKGTLVNYLVYMPEYGVDVGNYMKPAKTWLCVGLPCKVTHWMPLPEVPKEDQE